MKTEKAALWVVGITALIITGSVEYQTHRTKMIAKQVEILQHQKDSLYEIYLHGGDESTFLEQADRITLQQQALEHQ